MQNAIVQTIKMADKLKIMLKMFADFEEHELEKISGCFKPKSFKKNGILLHEGNVCKEFYFINTGCVRTFFIDKNGHEKIRYVMLDNHMGTALTSFIAQKPSIEFSEALDDTELSAIRYSNFFRLNREVVSWKIFYQRILEMAYSFQNRLHYQNSPCRLVVGKATLLTLATMLSGFLKRTKMRSNDNKRKNNEPLTRNRQKAG